MEFAWSTLNYKDALAITGASPVVGRSTFIEGAWAGAIDVAGEVVLANVPASMRYRGVAAAYGLAGGMEVPTTVAPFILRAVTLVGIDSVVCSKPERLIAWQQLAHELEMAKLDAMTTEVQLADVIAMAPRFLEGTVRGRILVPVNPQITGSRTSREPGLLNHSHGGPFNYSPMPPSASQEISLPPATRCRRDGAPRRLYVISRDCGWGG